MRNFPETLNKKVLRRFDVKMFCLTSACLIKAKDTGTQTKKAFQITEKTMEKAMLRNWTKVRVKGRNIARV